MIFCDPEHREIESRPGTAKVGDLYLVGGRDHVVAGRIGGAAVLEPTMELNTVWYVKRKPRQEGHLDAHVSRSYSLDAAKGVMDHALKEMLDGKPRYERVWIEDESGSVLASQTTTEEVA